MADFDRLNGRKRRKALFMETTKIPAEVTAGEVQSILGRAGASHVMVEYKDGVAEGITFKVGPASYKLPCRYDAIFQILHSRRGRRQNDSTAVADSMQARRVAWRQILRWIEAQMAFMETEMVTADEIFLPYAVTKGGRTLYELVQHDGLPQLTHKAE